MKDKNLCLKKPCQFSSKVGGISSKVQVVQIKKIFDICEIYTDVRFHTKN